MSFIEIAFYHWKSWFQEKSLSTPRGETKCITAHSLSHWHIGEILICKTINKSFLVSLLFTVWTRLCKHHGGMKTAWRTEKDQEILNEKNLPSFNLFEVFSSSHCPAVVRKRSRISQPQQLQRTMTWNWKISASLPWSCTLSSNNMEKKSKNGEILIDIPLNDSPTTVSALDPNKRKSAGSPAHWHSEHWCRDCR